MPTEPIRIPFATVPMPEYADMLTWIAEQLQLREVAGVDGETNTWHGSISPDRGILMEADV